MDNQVSTAVVITIAAVGGAAGALISSLVNVLLEWRKDKREHVRWTREKRWESYAALIETMDFFAGYGVAWHQTEYKTPMDDDAYAAMNAYRRALKRAILISTEETGRDIETCITGFDLARKKDTFDEEGVFKAVRLMQDVLRLAMKQS